MDVSAQQFREVQILVRRLCGLVLTDEKTYLVRSRLESVVKAHGFATFSEYLARVQEIDAMLMRDELVEALTTGETSFSRDGHPFDEFRRRVMPELAERVRERRETGYLVPRARIWSAGCSTGQEAYSLAIAIQEFLAANPKLNLRAEQFPILATDVSAKALDVARRGRYSSREVERGLTPELRNRYFQPDGVVWAASEKIRRCIEFRRLNFLDRIDDLGLFDVIFCRNVLIYFDVSTRERLSDQFDQMLVPGGILVLGSAESLYGLESPLASENLGSTVVYRKKRMNDEG